MKTNASPAYTKPAIEDAPINESSLHQRWMALCACCHPADFPREKDEREQWAFIEAKRNEVLLGQHSVSRSHHSFLENAVVSTIAKRRQALQAAFSNNTNLSIKAMITSDVSFTHHPRFFGVQLAQEAFKRTELYSAPPDVLMKSFLEPDTYRRALWEDLILNSLENLAWPQNKSHDVQPAPGERGLTAEIKGNAAAFLKILLSDLGEPIPFETIVGAVWPTGTTAKGETVESGNVRTVKQSLIKEVPWLKSHIESVSGIPGSYKLTGLNEGELNELRRVTRPDSAI